MTAGGSGMATTEVLPATELLARIGRMVERSLPLWGLSPSARATMINHSENVTYRIDDPASGGRSILRVHRVGYHSQEAIRSELQWMEALRREAGVETPETIPAKNGSVIQILRSPELDHPRHAVMFTFLEGKEPAEDELLGPFERLGEVSARMHRHAAGWTLPPRKPRSRSSMRAAHGWRRNSGGCMRLQRQPPPTTTSIPSAAPKRLTPSAFCPILSDGRFTTSGSRTSGTNAPTVCATRIICAN